MTRRLMMVLPMVALAVAALVPTAQAQPTDRRTFLTFSAPVEIPGRVLPAGRYEFRLADDGETMDVVQVLEDDKVIGTFLTVPMESRKDPKNAYVTFEKPIAGSPPAVRAWFYPGDPIGQEFVYPKRRALMLARAAQEPVKTTTDDMTAHMNAEQPAAQEQAVAALKEAPVQVAKPVGERVEVFETTTIEMPKTASSMPWQVLGGGMLILLGLSIRYLRRQAVTG